MVKAITVGDSVVDWLRALVLLSGSPRFQAPTLPLARFVLVVPSSNPRPRFVNSRLVCLLTGWD